MKILQVLDTFYPNVDGPVNVIVNIAKICNEKGWADVELLVPKYPKNHEIEGLTIHRSKSMKSAEGYRMSVPFFDKKMKKLFKQGGYDAIHVHSPFTLGKYAVKWAKKMNIPVAMTVHTKYKSDFERKLKSKALQKFMMNFIMKPINNSDYVLSVSNGASETLREYGCTHKDIFVIRNGTDMKPVEIDEKLKEEIRAKYNLQNKFTFLFVGRIVENKNVQFSLKVLNLLKQKYGKDFVFVIVGEGNYVDELKKIAVEYGLSDNLIFTGKIMDRKQLSAVYACADLFLFPSTFDTCGIVALEAAVNSLPSVMICNSCASELVVNGQNGLALEENAELWAEEIAKIMDSESTLQAMKDDVTKSLYIPWEKIVKEYVDFYQKMIDEKTENEKKQNL